VVPTGAYLLRRATRSLDELTVAADRVARGDLSPELPPAGRDEVGRLTGAFRVMVSEVRRTMAEIEQSRQLAAIGEFAAELSHEIRNPLTAIKLNLQRLDRMIGVDGVPQAAAKPVAIALGEIKRLDRVVRGVLRLGRPASAGERSELAIVDIIHRALELVRPQVEAAGIDVHLDTEPAFVMGDEEQLVGALVNLLLNAVEAMPNGGVMRIRTSVTVVDGTSFADIHVADSGAGIPEAARAKLFRAFVTTKPDGTGLGLALALRTAEAHGGTITLIDTSSAGTEFRVRLPLVATRAHA
jgi:signal transduction histidine kinase